MKTIEIRVQNKPCEDFESCSKCVHAEDSSEICMLRQCIHAFSTLKECYKPKETENESIRTLYYKSNFKNYWSALRNFISRHIIDGDYVSIGDIAEYLHQHCKINIYKAEAIAEVVVASMSVYREKFVRTSAKVVQEKATNKGRLTYCFYTAANQYFDWVDKKFNDIMDETIDGELYLIDNIVGKTAQYNVVLGILETMDILSFKMLGGANSQLYIYINQIENIKNIINNPRRYENSLLNTVNDRHDLSVKMLTYLYENDFQSEEIWNILEDYFLGVVPEKVKQMCRKDNPNMILESIN